MFGQVEEILALGLVFVVHVVGGLLLVWGVLGDEQRGPWWRRRRGGDDGDEPPRMPPAAQPPWPLADASPSPVRLREDARVGDGYPRPSRRPEHPAKPVPARRERS